MPPMPLIFPPPSPVAKFGAMISSPRSASAPGVNPSGSIRAGCSAASGNALGGLAAGGGGGAAFRLPLPPGLAGRPRPPRRGILRALGPDRPAGRRGRAIGLLVETAKEVVDMGAVHAGVEQFLADLDGVVEVAFLLELLSVAQSFLNLPAIQARARAAVVAPPADIRGVVAS